ncbi:hypothetical protein [uncultured Brachyspira sp.]|uniref:hypothetical protein n=1 Tax=uncultured Brachyspira sp. TaxID=221953 RepID=UPI0025983526|nr:hypothetical protein [uncultured Brachyspira sp.]
MPFNVQLNYKIYNKNAVLREAYPKDIRLFYTNTERYLAAGTQSVGKRTGVLPYGHASQGAKPPQTKNLKIFFRNLKVFTAQEPDILQLGIP